MLRAQEIATGEESVVTCGLEMIQLQQEGSQTLSRSQNVRIWNHNVNTGTKLLDEAKTRGLFPVPQKGPHLQGQSLGPQSLQNTVPSSNEVIHAVVNFLEGGVELQRLIHWDGGVRVLWRDAGTGLALQAAQLLGSRNTWPLCLSAKAKSEEQPEGMMQESRCLREKKTPRRRWPLFAPGKNSFPPTWHSAEECRTQGPSIPASPP